MAFRHDGQVVFQIQLARRQDAILLTGDYMWKVNEQWPKRLSLATASAL